MPENTQQSLEENKKTSKRTVLLSELGAQLPIGTPEGGSLVKDMSHKPWKLKQERYLGELRSKHRDANMAQYISMILGTMYNSLGGVSLSDMSLSDQRGRISRMFIGDVFYSYIWLRCVALGSVFHTNVTCPHCGFKFHLPADLDTIEVEVVDSLEDAKWDYQLVDPFKVGDTEITKFEMGPAKWRSLEGADFTGGLNTGAVKAMIIRGSIMNCPELTRGALSDSDLDEMTKRDFELLTAEIDKRSLGPDMAIEEKCKRCSSEFRVSIDWGYDSFFAVSSRSDQ